MSTEQQTAPPLMDFYDNYQAPLPAGSYRLVLQQSVSLKGGETNHYYRDQPFEVLAPRYAIEGSEIQAYFPPPGGTADYRNVLPHLVLRTRNLPWERQVWSKEKGVPWLALLVLSEQEALEGRAVVQTGTIADLAPDDAKANVWSRAVGRVRREKIRLPMFTREEDTKTSVRLLDLDLDLFLQLCPRREELPLLAHVRRVDTADKVPLEMVADGEFAVLVANRFPEAGANTVHLVSLEGWRELLDAPAEAPHFETRVRLVTLGSWGFVCDAAGQDTFGGLMRRLRGNAAAIGVPPLARGGDAYVNGALVRGYVPVDYRPLDSTPAFAWYRGPLSPLVTRPHGQPPFKRADAALVYDDRKGLFDVSYAAAWQLGRLLALASPSFTKGLRLFVEQAHDAAEFVRQVKEFVALHRSDFKLKEKPPEDERIAVADELVEWIARAVLLYPVPFNYLVPHTALLPKESLRFFHLDDNWVDALVDGALSVAVRSHVDEGVARREDVQSALSKIVYQHRLRLQGKRPVWDPSESYMDVPKSGFLLRSSVVTDWPGVEVTAKTDAPPDANLPEILRLDQIADGVLFCLARGSIKEVTFREPREGLTFGVDSDGNVEARTSRKRLKVRPDLLRDGARPGVADVAALRAKLAESERRVVGPAEFAMQMIRMPEEQVIEWAEAR